MATYGYITLGKATEKHFGTLEELGYDVELVTDHDTLVDHIRVRIAGFITKPQVIRGALLDKIAEKKGALTYDVEHKVNGEDRKGIKLCGAIRKGCKLTKRADLSCLVMRRDPKAKAKPKAGSSVEDKEVNFDF